MQLLIFDVLESELCNGCNRGSRLPTAHQKVNNIYSLVIRTALCNLSNTIKHRILILVSVRAQSLYNQMSYSDLHFIVCEKEIRAFVFSKIILSSDSH